MIALNFSYMIAIPMRFLVEADNLPERDTWPLECTAKDVWIPQIASPPNVASPAPTWTADVNPPNHYALFNPVGCTVTKLDLAQIGDGLCDLRELAAVRSTCRCHQLASRVGLSLTPQQT